MMQQLEKNHDDQVTREELLLDLECEIQGSRGLTFDIPPKFFSLFPKFTWREGDVECTAEMVFSRFRITQVKTT